MIPFIYYVILILGFIFHIFILFYYPLLLIIIILYDFDLHLIQYNDHISSAWSMYSLFFCFIYLNLLCFLLYINV